MRPRTEVREALAEATRALVDEGRAGVTWAEAALHAQVALDLGRRTMDNMARAGELERVGRQLAPGARRPMTLFALAQPAAGDAGAGDEVPPLLLLDDVLRGWLPAG